MDYQRGKTVGAGAASDGDSTARLGEQTPRLTTRSVVIHSYDAERRTTLFTPAKSATL